MLLPTAYYGNAGPAKAVTPVGQVGGFIVQRSSGGTILPAAYCLPYTLSVSLRLCAFALKQERPPHVSSPARHR